MSHPQIDLNLFARYCQIRWKPQLIQGFLLSWLTQHFQSVLNIEDPDLQHLVWTSDRSTTKLLIDVGSRFNPDLIEKRPAVLLRRGKQIKQRQGIDDRIMPYVPDGNDRYSTMWLGSHTIRCLSKEDGEADILATEVARELCEFASKFREGLNLHRIEVGEISESEKVEKNVDYWTVSVSLTYAYEHTWMVTPDNVPNLKHIDLAFFHP